MSAIGRVELIVPEGGRDMARPVDGEVEDVWAVVVASLIAHRSRSDGCGEIVAFGGDEHDD